MGIFIDTQQWPVVVSQVGNDLSVSDMLQLLHGLDAVLARRERVAIALDLQHMTRSPGPAEQRVLGSWLRTHANNVRCFVMAVAVVGARDEVKAVLGQLMQRVGGQQLIPNACFEPTLARAHRFCEAAL